MRLYRARIHSVKFYPHLAAIFILPEIREVLHD